MYFSVATGKTTATAQLRPAAPTVIATPSTSLLGVLSRIYSKSLQNRPLLTKTAMAAAVFFGSDSATQYILRPDTPDEKEFYWDAPRALSGATFGVVATTWLHYWWGFLEAAVNVRYPVTAAAAHSKLTNTAIKVALDQGLGAPLYIYTYYVLTNFGQSLSQPDVSSSEAKVLQSWKDTNARAAEMLWPTMLKHWTVWPAVHLANFYFMPLHHRVLVQNTVLVGWSGYLSHLNNGGLDLKIMTPIEEVKGTIQRQETSQRLAQEAADLAALESKNKKNTTKRVNATNTATATLAAPATTMEKV
jgi:protein Mpv17